VTLQTAVLFIVFNRPETTARVFEAIRAASPRRLYIAADGPRTGNTSDQQRCAQVRDIVSNVNWPCDVRTRFLETNLGCRLAVSKAISWFFENEELGIILEDDTLPSESFFLYAQSLLERYVDDERIFMVSGYNNFEMWRAEQCHYFFSLIGSIWGWGSWRRAWQHYDIEMKRFDEFYSANMFQCLFGRLPGERRAATLKKAKSVEFGTWDYQWSLARHMNSGLSCVPSRSLISNIGFGPDATHTTSGENKIIHQEIELPIKLNDFVVADAEYDRKLIEGPSIVSRATRKVRRMLSA
jgi:hypothetical protein